MRDAQKAAGAFVVLFVAIIFTTGEPEMPRLPTFEEIAGAEIDAAYGHAVEVSQGKTYYGPMRPEVKAAVIMRRADEISGIGRLCERMGCISQANHAYSRYEELYPLSRKVESEGQA